MKTNIDKNAVRIRTPFLSENKKKLLLAAVIVVFAVVLLNVFLESKKQAPFIQKDSVTLFLENVMIREDGLFTLLGSKPMTLFDITETSSETEEELREEYEQSKAFLEKCKQDPEHFRSDVMTLPPYNEYREKCLKQKDTMRFHDHKKLWENWLNEQGRVSSSLYKLTSRGDMGLLINVPNTLYILKKHYIDFAEITGIEFDIDSVLDQVEDLESEFWNGVFKNHYLFGLMMGYGQKNAYLFDWVSRHSLSVKALSLCRFKELSRLNRHVDVIRKINVDVSDLEVPYFVSFEIYDEDVERYSREREKIIHFLEDKELIPFVLQQLG